MGYGAAAWTAGTTWIYKDIAIYVANYIVIAVAIKTDDSFLYSR